MFTVALMLILIPLTTVFENAILENWWINLFPGLNFLIVGFVGGWLTDTEYRKAILMVAVSYIVIGLFTVLNVSIVCQTADCFYINLTLLGIPIGIILTSLGLLMGFKLKEYQAKKQENSIQATNEL